MTDRRPLGLAERIAALRWGSATPIELVLGASRAGCTPEEELALWAMTVLGRGTIDDVRALLGARRAEKAWDALAARCPLVGISAGEESFAALSVSLGEVRDHGRARLQALAETCGFAGQGGGDGGFGGALDGAWGMRARRERDDAAGAPAGPRPVAGGERLGGPVGRRGRRGVRALRLGDPHPNGSPCGHQRHDRLGLGAAGRSRAGRSVRPAQPCLGEEHAANGPVCGIGGLGGGQRGHAPGHGGDGRLLPG